MFYDTVLASLTPADSELNRLFQSAAVIGVNNVADLLIGLEDQRDGAALVQLKDLPNANPLAPVIWCEWSRHPHMRKEAFTQQFGALFVVRQINNGVLYNEAPTPQPRYVSQMAMFMLDNARKPILFMPDANPSIWVNKHGKVIGFMLDPHHLPDVIAADFPEGTDLREVATEVVVHFLAIALVAMTFGHHREAQIIRHPASRLIVKGRPPLASWQEIDIAPVVADLREHGNLDTDGIGAALRACAGSFERPRNGTANEQTTVILPSGQVPQ